MVTSNSILRKKLRKARGQSAAAGAKIGPTIPQGMKMYITAIRPVNNTTTLTTVTFYSGVSGTKNQTQLTSALPALPNNDVGYKDSWQEGDIDSPVCVIEPGMSSGTRSNTELYAFDGGQRVNVEIEYYLDY